MSRSVVAIATICVTLAACAREQPPPYDLVVANGRVLDPESGLDAVRHLGIRGGKIEVVSETPLTGVRAIDASRHVVSPGKQFSTRVALPVVHEAAFGVAWTTSEFDDSVVPVRLRTA